MAVLEIRVCMQDLEPFDSSLANGSEIVKVVGSSKQHAIDLYLADFRELSHTYNKNICNQPLAMFMSTWTDDTKENLLKSTTVAIL